MSEDYAKNLIFLGRKTINPPPFRARLPWIGGDLQTLHNTIVRPAPDFSAYPQRRIELPMNDGTGDTLLAMYNQPQSDARNPLVVLVHGLTGCETSRNIMVSAAYHLSRNYPVLRLNLRGAGPSLGKCDGHYHAGKSEDLRTAISSLPLPMKSSGIFVVGVSLGGNVVLKYLAENAERDGVIGGASVCAPIDLKMSQLRIMSPRNAVYHRHLLQSMKADARKWIGNTAEQAKRVLERINSVFEFDDLIVAPNSGFNGAEDYYRRCSAVNFLSDIAKPTLLLHPRTDPWVPVQMYLEQSWPDQGNLTLLIPPDGGHVGFHATGSTIPWHDRCIGMFLDLLIT